MGYSIKKYYDTDADDDSGGSDKPAPKKMIRLFDRRKTVAATGVPFSDKYSKTGSYDPEIIGNIIKAAKFNGVDPNTAIALALQETSLGKLDPDNIGASLMKPGAYGKAPKGMNQDAYEFTRLLKEKMAYGQKLGYDDEAHQLQAYNGLGKLANKGDYQLGGVAQNQSFYGKQLKPGESLDLKENPLYGKTVIDLRDNLIKNNPDIQNMIGADKTAPLVKPETPLTVPQRLQWNGMLDHINSGATPEQAFDGAPISPEMIQQVQQEHTAMRQDPNSPALSDAFMKQPVDLDGQMGDNTKKLYYPTIQTPDKDYGADIENYLKDKVS